LLLAMLSACGANKPTYQLCSHITRMHRFDGSLPTTNQNKCMVKVYLTKTYIAAIHGQFNRIRKGVTTCNTCFLGPIRLHGISICSAIFAQLTAERPYTLRPTTGRSSAIKIASSCGTYGPHLIHDSLGPSEPTTQTTSRSI